MFRGFLGMGRQPSRPDALDISSTPKHISGPCWELGNSRFFGANGLPARLGLGESDVPALSGKVPPPLATFLGDQTVS
jgi:hypothetical protein